MAETVAEASRILNVDAYWSFHSERQEVPDMQDAVSSEEETVNQKDKKSPPAKKKTPAPKKKSPVKKPPAKNVGQVVKGKVVTAADKNKENRSAEVTSMRQNWGSGEETIDVLYLTDERTEQLKVTKDTTLLDLFKKCEYVFNLEINKMRIVVQHPKDGSYRQYDGVDKAVRSKLLPDVGVSPNDTLRLISMMFVFPMEGSALSATKHIEKAIFDLFWGYPKRGRDYLDGSCLVYSRDGQFLSYVDYSHRVHTCIEHSGDVMNDHSKQGHHTIKVDMTKITEEMNTFYFVLSAYSSKSVSDYPDPTVMLFDHRDQSQELCPPHVKKFDTSARALILCALTRSETEGAAWDVVALGTTCEGNVMNYSPIKKAIETECHPVVTSVRQQTLESAPTAEASEAVAEEKKEEKAPQETKAEGLEVAEEQQPVVPEEKPAE